MKARSILRKQGGYDGIPGIRKRVIIGGKRLRIGSTLLEFQINPPSQRPGQQQQCRRKNTCTILPVRLWWYSFRSFDRKRYNEDGVGGMHVSFPWWLDNKKPDFPRGYHIEYWGGGQPSYGFSWGIEGLNGKYPVHGQQKEVGGYGKSLKRRLPVFSMDVASEQGRKEAILSNQTLRNRIPMW